MSEVAVTSQVENKHYIKNANHSYISTCYTCTVILIATATSSP